MHPTSTRTKQEVLDLIINGGLLEDFIEWARRKGVPIDFATKPDEVDPQILKEYAAERGLLADTPTALEDDDEEVDIETLEPREIRPRTPPRRQSA